MSTHGAVPACAAQVPGFLASLFMCGSMPPHAVCPHTRRAAHSAAPACAVQALESLAVQSTPAQDAAALTEACKAGIARCLLQRGDLRQGRTIALQLKSQQLYKECAHILDA